MALSARIPSGVDNAGFVPELWSKNVLDAIHSRLVVVPLVDHTWEPELTKGDTMNVGILNTATATEVTVGTEGVVNDIATGTKLQIVINKWYEAPIVIDEMTDLQSQVSLRGKAEREAAYAVVKKMDSTLCDLFDNFASTEGTDGSAVTDDVLILCVETLDEADVPDDQRVWVFDPSGSKLGRIDVPEVAANLAWGGGDWKTLYITGSTSLYRVRLNIEGIKVP